MRAHQQCSPDQLDPLAVTCYERIAEVVNATRPTGDDQQSIQPRVVLDDLSVKAAVGEHH